VAGLLAACLLATLTAPEPSRALLGTYSRWAGSGAYFIYAVLGLATAVAFAGDAATRRLPPIVVGAGAAVAAYGLLQAAGLDPMPWRAVYGDAVVSTLGNPNFASAFMGITVPIAAAIVLDPGRGKAARSTAGVALVALSGAILLTQSLQGLLAAAGGLWLLALAWVLGREDPLRRLLIRVWMVGTALGAVAAGAFLATAGPPRTLVLRTYYWRAALAMAASDPFTGVGLGGYGDHFRAYRPLAMWQELGTTVTADSAHSVPLQMLAEGGIPLALAYLGLVGTVAVALIRGLRTFRGNSLIRLGGLGGAWAAYQLQSLVSIDVPSLALLHMVMAGGIWAATAGESEEVRGKRRSARPSARMAGIGILALVVVGALAVIRPYRADLWARRGARAAVEDVEGAVDALTRAVAIAPWEARYFFERGATFDQAQRWEEALVDYERAGRIAPRYWEAVLSAARLSAFLGAHDKAAAWYGQVLVIEPEAPDFKVEVANFYLVTGKPGPAGSLLEEAVALVPDRAEWWLLLAQARRETGDLQGADAATARAAELSG
jgi:O-antigen ligase/Flp pilus assembly protein TadD